MSDGGFISQHDCWHWQHIWSSPWTQQVGGGLIAATPPNAGFTGGPPRTIVPPLVSIPGNQSVRIGNGKAGPLA
jgi:hypothetical protein